MQGTLGSIPTEAHAPRAPDPKQEKPVQGEAPNPNQRAVPLSRHN